MTDPIRARDIIAHMEAWAPPRFAFPGDPIGLQLGRSQQPVRRLMLALDASLPVVRAAVQAGADMLITHHAMLYRPAARIDTSTAHGQAIAQALAADLTVYAAHTNLDVAPGGVNDVLADLLGLQNVEILDRMGHDTLRKLVIYVPVDHADALRDAICTAGAGHIGSYSHCTFQTRGEGTFLPLPGAAPYAGEVGRLERTAEVRLETIVPEGAVDNVIAAMHATHPYEEVAYDLLTLVQPDAPYGIGRVGNLPAAMPLGAFAAAARDVLKMPHIRFGGDPNFRVTRVAVLGGSGGKWAGKALAADAHVLLTADCDHHAVSEAWLDGLAIVDATHAALERPVLPAVHERLRRRFGSSLDILVADVQEDPFHWI